MRNLQLITAFGALLFSACGTVQNTYQLEEDDAYFSRRQASSKTIVTPDVDVNKIMQQYPSRVSEGYFDNRPSDANINPNAASAYYNYRAETDSLYKKHPEQASNYNSYKAPPFDEREEARKLRRSNRWYNNSYFGLNYNYGYGYGWNNFYRPYYGNRFWNRNAWSPGWNLGFGWNSYNGWNWGLGYNSFWGLNSGLGWNDPFYGGYGYNNWCSPYSNWGYNNWGWNYPYYGYGNGWYNPYSYYTYPGYHDNHSIGSGSNPVNRPRTMSGSDIPPTVNGGNVNNTPRVGGNGQMIERPAVNNNEVTSNPANEVPRAGTYQPEQSNNNYQRNTGAASLKRSEDGNYQYTPPANYNRATGSTEIPDNRNYSSYGRGSSDNYVPASRNDNNVMQREQRNNDYQPAPSYDNNTRSMQRIEPSSRSGNSSPSFSGPRSTGGGGGGTISRPRL